MKKLFVFSLVAIMAIALSQTSVAKRDTGILRGESNSVVARKAAMPAPVSTTVTVKLDGSGFLCLGDGHTCKVELTVTFGAARSVINGNPIPPGAEAGVITTIDNAPVPPGPPVEIGMRSIAGGSMIPAQPHGVTIPAQTGEFDPELGGYLFYYYEN